MKKEIIGFVIAFILSHLVSMYIMGGYDKQTLDSKFVATLTGCGVGLIVTMLVNFEKHD